jgi:hypothetical protein
MMFEEKTRRLARISLSHEMLHSLLKVPDGAKIESIRVGDFYDDAFSILVSHPSFSPVSEGGYIPEIIVWVMEDADGRVTFDWAMPGMEERDGDRSE